jgi:hypothetical protein
LSAVAAGASGRTKICLWVRLLTMAALRLDDTPSPLQWNLNEDWMILLLH